MLTFLPINSSKIFLYGLKLTPPYINKEKFLKKNPHIKQVIGAPNIIGGHGDRVKIDGGFKDVLNKIGDAHPGSEVHARHGSKDIKREKSVKTIKKHMDIQSRK